MRPPEFWNTPASAPSVIAKLLSPLGALYAAATRRRVARTAATHLPAPVICVGNLNAGGTGKTPTVIALLQRLADRNITAHVVSRGYGGKLDGPVQVDPRTHSADDVGDEPLLLAAFAPVWVAKDRALGGLSAASAGAEVVILDDGFQNPSLAKDMSIIVVDASRGFGNGLCLPAGPLREPVDAGMRRATAVLSIGDAPAQHSFAQAWSEQITVPHLTGALTPLQTGMDWDGMRVLAFAGIGHPEKFFATLRTMGADIVKTKALDDHQPLTKQLMQRLQTEANALGAQLVTTEKDAVRLPAAFRMAVLTVPVRLEITDWSALDDALARVIPAYSAANGI